MTIQPRIPRNSGELRATHLLGEILDALADHVALLASNGDVVAVNEAWTQFATDNGYPDGGTGLGVNYPGVCERGTDDGSEAAEAARGIRAVLAGSRNGFVLDYPCHSPTELRWYRMTVRPVHLVGPVAAIVIHTDRTAEHLAILRVIEERDSADAAHTARATEQALFRALTEQSLEFVSILDDDGRFSYVSPSVVRTLGYSPGELVGTFPVDLVHDEDRKTMLGTYRTLTGGGPAAVAEMCVRLRHKDGAWRYFEGGGQNLLHDPAVHGITSNARDVTARWAAEKAVRFRADLLDAVEQAVIATDLEGRITYWNRFAGVLYGWSSEETCGKNIQDVTPMGATREQTEALMQALRRGESWTGEFAVVARDGRRIHVQVTDSPIHTADGTLDGIVGVSVDVSERRGLEERLRQSQRLEAIGQLAGGVAHDFNNLLTVIGAHSAYLLDEIPADQPAAADARAIQEAGHRAAVLTRQLLAFSRKQFFSLSVVDLNVIITDTRRMFGRLLGDDIEVELQLGDDLGWVLVDAGQVEQVIMNLALNARDAMPAGGRVTITTSGLSLTAPHATFDGVPAGMYAVLTMSDTGTGMDKATQARMFEPFFTTKEFGSGTGLGLSTVYGIVKQSDGYLFVRSAPGQGTSIDILFPLASAEPEHSAANPEKIAHHAGAGIILLVEDDSAVRNIAKRVLVREGYEVLEAGNGAEAVKLSDEHAGTIHLVLSDAVMPGMTGIAVLEHVRSARPSCRAILMSGYTDDEMTRRGIKAADVAFIQKPFTPADLAQLVRRTLDGPLTTEQEST
jgi:two-component system cell cycle sensor histidine kinase/response regulator CckA